MEPGDGCLRNGIPYPLQPSLTHTKILGGAFTPFAGVLLLQQESCCRLSSFTSLARVLLLDAILKNKDFRLSPCSRDSPMPAIFHVQQAAGPERLARFRHDGSVPPERAVCRSAFPARGGYPPTGALMPRPSPHSWSSSVEND